MKRNVTKGTPPGVAYVSKEQLTAFLRQEVEDYATDNPNQTVHKDTIKMFSKLVCPGTGVKGYCTFKVSAH